MKKKISFAKNVCFLCTLLSYYLLNDCFFYARQARNAAVFAHGGTKQHLRTQLGLYRQSGSGFTKSLDSGGFVQLGEELLLRAQVKAGDGKKN